MAVVNCVELQWPARVAKELLHKHPEIALNAFRIVERRLREMECRLRELSNEAVDQRIAHALLRLVRKVGRQVAHGVEVPFPLSRQDLADMSGTTLHTVSRTLGVWESQGLVKRGRRRVTIVEASSLAAIAEKVAASEAQPRRTHRRTARKALD
jgi:CRP-like cAMP-binding protein